MVENDKREFKMITLCGSTRFKEEFMKEAERLTLNNYIVLMPHVFAHDTGIILDRNRKVAFDEMHRKMIDMSDAILVINKGGYIGESTKAEIEYAKVNNKKVYYMYIQCEDDCAYHYYGDWIAKRKLPYFESKFTNDYPTCPYYCIEDK